MLVDEMKLPRAMFGLLRHEYLEMMCYDGLGNSWMNFSGQSASCISIQELQFRTEQLSQVLRV
jgi:hypothetical protein